MDLPELASCPGPVGTVEFAALAGGSTQIPKLNGGLNIHIRLSADGSIPVAQLESLQALTVQGMRVELPSLAELGSGEVSASLGATIDLPSLAR
ncbi:MAG: hypothetical protein FJ405_17785, partial [Verrucomicrobia bacterium]|nr:hypothetical protein [Verrucomicrobiota bacterium]